eukprot:TRINITY_DN71288_c0_g1_i1.p1 TRINITY_DN71288_c0_g1~~TRINITY_DN71288_c0_g1_i1.p1  ORF type:complete len:402 (-),score=50.78 TRINITY_DN71288_c0_g1_i1:45-1250(-)
MSRVGGGFLLGVVATGAAAVFGKRNGVDVVKQIDQWFADKLPDVTYSNKLDLFVPPKTTQICSTSAFTSEVNYKTKVPNWVMEHVKRSDVEAAEQKKDAKGTRTKSNFTPDHNIPLHFRATNDDYWDSGWARGHMAPASLHQRDQTEMDDTFLLSNIVPQDLANNGTEWLRLELFVKSLLGKKHNYTDVYIISGPLFNEQDAMQTLDKRRLGLPASFPFQQINTCKVPFSIVNYPVVGKNKVAVPTHLYKVVVAENNNSITPNRAVAAFIMPNQPTPNFMADAPLTVYQVGLGEVERQAGMVLFDGIRDKVDKFDNLCRCTGGCKGPSTGFVNYWRDFGKIQSAKTLPELQDAWQGCVGKKSATDHIFTKLYAAKKAQLETLKEQAGAAAPQLGEVTTTLK